jgi:hypothetical protein
MEILSSNTQVRRWFPDIDTSKKPICYKAFNNPRSEGVCSYCPTCKTLVDGETHEAITDTPVGDEIRNYKIVSSPIKNAEGKVIAAIEMVEDITERANPGSISETTKLFNHYFRRRLWQSWFLIPPEKLRCGALPPGVFSAGKQKKF